MDCDLCAILNSLVGKITEPVCRQVGYIFNYEDNIASLTTEITSLSAAKIGMQQKIDQAKRNVEGILANVDNWMRVADDFDKEADKIKKDDGHAKAKCSFRSFPNLVLRHRLSRRAKKMAASIATLRANIPEGLISYSQVLPGSVEVIEGYEAFQSRMLIINHIMDALRNPKVQVIGLHGMGGIGKTMLAKEVSRRARLKLFEIVVMVSVSQDPKPKDIQQHIAEKLGLTLHEETVSVRADKLRERLKHEKKILLTLDNVWDKIDLHEIGVSFGNDQKGCKILLTSRSANVCDNMKAELSFKLPVLSEEEATNLFNKNVSVSVRGPNFEKLAKEIIEECAGLPIAIVVVASALKNRGEQVWEDVLLELRTSSPTNIEDMDKKVYSSIKLSYNRLPNDYAKELLLLCSLHAEDEAILIEDLVKFGMGSSWFDNIKRLKEARNRVYHLVVTLKERSLLLDDIDGRSVKLHDVIRDVCLYIASQDKDLHFIRDIDHLEVCIQNEKLEKATGISLPLEAINQLPQKVKWPHLKLLLLRKGNIEVKIMDEQCFNEMKNLKVLYLRDIQVNPTCFSLLQELQTLCLRGCCFLGDIAPISDLNKLKILDLAKSDFLKLPKVIGQWTQLWLLDLSGCESLKVIQPNVISELIHLEELRLPKSLVTWGADGASTGTKRGSACLSELKNLPQLTVLELSVPDFSYLPKDFFSEKWMECKITTNKGLFIFMCC